ncbi:ABC transporter permease [Fulvivirgaceae bacterium BMA10]|uniref:ABC transporter permease n=1 Tax=Splendidivirga corallicola TaxID=3051826 RepID=A0ABT8KK11_9BACT|nr:ABC transporter permease [Fulvivirgaceae bacterium BMA10]
MLKELIELIKIHFKEFFREPGIIFWAILFPILMAWGLGTAFTKKGELIRTVAYVEQANTDSDNGPSFITALLSKTKVNENGLFTATFGNDKLGITTYKFVPSNWDEAIIKLKRGEVNLILDHRKDSLEYHFDPLNPEAQLAYLQLHGLINQQDLSNDEASIQPLTQIGTRYIDFLVPGLMALNVMMSCMWGIGYSLIDKRMKKLLRRMVATPMRKSSFLIAQFISRVTLSGLEAVLLVVFTMLYFDIEIQGNIGALILLFVSGNMAFTGIAILVSSRTSNTQVGNGLINAVVMPMMILSGVFFSYRNFPDWTVSIIEKFPLTLLADNLRSIFIEGAGLAQVLVPTVILAGLGVITFSVGLRIYKWY